jgi:hypothetical protein
MKKPVRTVFRRASCFPDSCLGGDSGGFERCSDGSDGLLLQSRRQMRIRVHRKADRRMPKPLLDNVRIHPGCAQHGRLLVAHIVDLKLAGGLARCARASNSASGWTPTTGRPSRFTNSKSSAFIRGLSACCRSRWSAGRRYSPVATSHHRSPSSSLSRSPVAIAAAAAAGALSGRPPDLHRRRRLARALALAPARRGAIAGCRTMTLYSICTSALYRCRV